MRRSTGFGAEPAGYGPSGVETECRRVACLFPYKFYMPSIGTVIRVDQGLIGINSFTVSLVEGQVWVFLGEASNTDAVPHWVFGTGYPPQIWLPPGDHIFTLINQGPDNVCRGTIVLMGLPNG